jgi:hypothetical protein
MVNVILSVPDEGYSRNALCALNLISTFYSLYQNASVCGIHICTSNVYMISEADVDVYSSLLPIIMRSGGINSMLYNYHF